MTVAIRTVFLMCLALVGLNAQAGDDSTASKSLADTLREYRAFEADFIQIVVDAQGRRVQEVQGNLKAKRPGLFYWYAEPPMEQYIVARGRYVEVYDPDLEQVTIQAMDQQMSSTPALLLSGEVDDLEESYRVSVQHHSGGVVDYTLEPRSPDSLFVTLRLRFRDQQLQEMRLQDSFEQISILSFRNVSINGTIDDSAFELAYPDGTDVIRSEG